MSVLVLVEQLDDVAAQTLTFARGYAGASDVEAVVFADVDGLGEHGVSVVHRAQLDGGFAPQAWAAAIAQVAGRTSPAAIVAAGTETGNEVLARTAILTGGALAANCLAATPGDVAEVTRARWGGSLLEEARLHGDLKLMTVAPHTVAIQPTAAVEASVQAFTPELTEADLVVQVVERVEASGGGMSLAEAPVVVSGGRGVGSAEGFAPLEELAAALGGVVGCSRAVTSAGWRPHTDQVGQTGTKIAPEIYIPCGISGATQHMAGCKGAKKILAINADREASIFARADYAVIGDLAEIVPAITAELQKR